MTKEEIKRIYGVASYRKWQDIPDRYQTKTALKRQGIIVPKDTKPDAIKNGSDTIHKDRIFFLYDIYKLK